MLLRVFPIFLVLFPRLGSTSPSNTTHNGTNGAVFPRAYPRDVYLIIEFKPDGGTWLSSDPIEVFPSHSFLYVTGTEQDGPLKIEISTDTTLPYDQALHIRVLDLTPANRDKVYIDNPDAGRAVVWQAGVSYSNRDFIDPETGSGFAAKAWAYDNVYRTGTGNFGRINTCNTFLQRLIEDNIGVQIHPRAWSYYMKAKKWTEEINLKGETTVIKELRLVTANTAGGPNFKRSWEISPLCAPHKSKRAGTCDAKVVPTDGESSSKVEPSSEQNELARDPIASSLPDSELNLDQDDTAVVDRATAASAEASISKVQKSKVVLARAGGKLTAYLAVGKEALTALNVAGSVAGAIFVILDFVEHNWVGGAVGAAGALAGVAIGFAVTGPLGWIIGGAVAGLFAILPGFLGKVHHPAEVTDVQGIIQWKMFGDKSHTGNEQCQNGTPDVPGNPDCQALYGPGTLSMAMGMNNFDAIIFLQQFNKGHAITIRDMAAAFYVVDPGKNGDGDDKIATIDCHNSNGTNLPANRVGNIGGNDPKLCNKPQFLIKREMIYLPYINQTADKVFNRIIPAPNGDCKLIVYPGDQYFPDPWNFTMTGAASAIACGLTAAINVTGTAVPVEGDTNGKTPEIGADPDQSTDHNQYGGAFVAPPPATPFKPLAQTDYVCIVHGKEQPFCLPPGSYHKQSGLGFEIRNVDSLTLPPDGWSLATHWKHRPQPHERTPQYTDRTYADNQDPTKKSDELSNFRSDIKALDNNVDGEATFTIVGPTDGPEPVCCLFTKPSFGGNVWCMGVGGGKVLPQWEDQAQSVSCHNGAQVWLYAKEYGDAGAALIKEDVQDLKDEPYGNNKGTFSKHVKALWVSAG